MVAVERKARLSLEAANRKLKAEQIMLRAEVEKLRTEQATTGDELVKFWEEQAKLMEEANNLIGQKNSLVTEAAGLSSLIDELSSSRDILSKDRVKSEKVAFETMDNLQGVLEYFGTSWTLPSTSDIPLLRRLKMIQAAAKMMKTTGIRCGEISCQVAALGILRYYEDLGLSVAPDSGAAPITFDDHQLLKPSDDVVAAWQAF
ncbi:hypothetical protein GUJ93_ZPchr0004g39745 [Zizania palustris]|uniref:Uncharacterized protein n=1 Tax=Zizania palustris TaxID=103762 RepID=A0A8J5VYS6_ZIZPA|nr:hypothetical protein GUJ93_ZPchr0004g39745 [Zizania palustris]